MKVSVSIKVNLWRDFDRTVVNETTTPDGVYLKTRLQIIVLMNVDAGGLEAGSDTLAWSPDDVQVQQSGLLKSHESATKERRVNPFTDAMEPSAPRR